MRKWYDIDGDENIGIDSDGFSVFACRGQKFWSINFGLSCEMGEGNWMDTMTGKGAFKTMAIIIPIVKKIVAEIESMGEEWIINAEPRRAKLYSRYVSKDKIRIIDLPLN